MSNWPSRNSIPMNSLFYSCIQKTPFYFNPKDNLKEQFKSNQISDTKLPLLIRQQIIDYFVRERIEINADLICELLIGSVNYFDLWSLCEINNFNDSDVHRILNQLTLNSSNLIELTIGGPEWIYNNSLIEGPLINLFKNGDLIKLKNLKLQQVSNDELVFLILNKCVNLIKFEIKEPSITDKQLNEVIKKLNKKSIDYKIEELTLPSTVRNNGLFECFKLFKNLKSISCSNFEPILDLLNDYLEMNENSEEDDELFDTNETIKFNSTYYTNKQFIYQLKKQLKQLLKLTITNPMGKYAVEQIVNYCPNIRELNLETQEIMYLKPICKLKELKSLSLHNSPNLPTSFLTEVLPILEDIGHQFISLSLEQFEVLDLSQINKYCPELNSLSAQWFTLISINRTTFRRQLNDPVNLISMSLQADRITTTFNKKTNGNEFSNLLRLRLRPRVNRDLSAIAIEYLIRNAKQLQYLELYCSKEFNDTLFNQWLKLNGFKSLKYLIIRNCNEELKESTIKKLKTSKELQYLELDRPPLDKTELIPI